MPRPRKNFLHVRMYGNHIRGVGGPGAPHVFAFDRAADLEGRETCTASSD